MGVAEAARIAESERGGEGKLTAASLVGGSEGHDGS